MDVDALARDALLERFAHDAIQAEMRLCGERVEAALRAELSRLWMESTPRGTFDAPTATPRSPDHSVELAHGLREDGTKMRWSMDLGEQEKPKPTHLGYGTRSTRRRSYLWYERERDDAEREILHKPSDRGRPPNPTYRMLSSGALDDVPEAAAASTATTGAASPPGTTIAPEDTEREASRELLMSARKDELPLDDASINEEDDPSKGKTFCSYVHKFLADALRRQWFDKIIGFFIFLNAVFIGIETDYAATHWADSETPRIFETIDSCFCAIFLAEMVIRVYMYGFHRFFTMQGWQWHIFDSCVVGAQVLEESAKFAANLHLVPSNILRAARVFRLARSLRVMRALHLVRELHDIMVAVVKAIRSLLWTFLLILLVMFIIGVLLTQLVTDHNRAHGGGREVLQGYYGSLLQTMLSLYMMISQGIQWQEASEPVMQYCSPWLIAVFIFYVNITVFGLVNVVTSVFVGAMSEARQESNQSSLMMQLKEVFGHTAAAQDGTNGGGAAGGPVQQGIVTNEEFRRHAKDPQFEAYLRSIDLSPDEAEDIFSLIDVGSTGALPIEDFVNGCLRLNGAARAIDLATLMGDFSAAQQNWDAQFEQIQGSLNTLLARRAGNGAVFGDVSRFVGGRDSAASTEC